jgi:hypothetical protein
MNTIEEKGVDPFDSIGVSESHADDDELFPAAPLYVETNCSSNGEYMHEHYASAFLPHASEMEDELTARQQQEQQQQDNATSHHRTPVETGTYLDWDFAIESTGQKVEDDVDSVVRQCSSMLGVDPTPYIELLERNLFLTKGDVLDISLDEYVLMNVPLKLAKMIRRMLTRSIRSAPPSTPNAPPIFGASSRSSSCGMTLHERVLHVQKTSSQTPLLPPQVSKPHQNYRTTPMKPPLNGSMLPPANAKTLPRPKSRGADI